MGKRGFSRRTIGAQPGVFGHVGQTVYKARAVITAHGSNPARDVRPCGDDDAKAENDAEERQAAHGAEYKAASETAQPRPRQAPQSPKP